MTPLTPTPKTRVDNQLDTLGDERDREDSDAIYSIFKALQPLGSPRLTSVKNRALREAVQKIWQEPRMRQGGSKFAHNKPLAYPWSPGARDLYFAHRDDPSVIMKNQLDLEHVTPIALLTEKLQAQLAGDCSSQEFFDEIKRVHEPLCFAVLTRKEHQTLGTKKAKAAIAAIAAGVNASLWARYEVGCGLKEKDFLSINDDPRFAAEPAAGRS
jgi:hypothetical protein